LANEVLLNPIDENLHVLKVGDEDSSIELTKYGNGARVNGDLEITGKIPVLATHRVTVPTDTTGQGSDLRLHSLSGDIIAQPNTSTGKFIVSMADVNIIELFPGGDATTTLKLMSVLDTGDYFQIGTSNNGATTITTVDGGGTGANLTFTIDGKVDINSSASDDIELDAGGDITLDAGGQQIYLKSDDNDFILFDYADGAMFIYGGPGEGTDSYLKIDCTSNGASTIRTVDEGIGSLGHLEIVVDGILTLDSLADVNIDAGGGQVWFKKSGTIWGYFDTITASTLKLITNTDYDLHLISSGTGDVVIDSNGDVDISSNDGNFIMRKGATEFSAANSAYAGMILGYSMIRNDQTYIGDNVSDSIITLNQTSYTLIASVGGTKAGVTFEAPPSGKVEIEFWAMFKSTNDYIQFGLSSSHSSYTEVEDLQTYNNNIAYFDETDIHPITIRWVLEGLSGSNTVYVWYKVQSGTSYFYHGEQFHHGTSYHYPPITTKATALPATFSITGD